MNNVMGQDMETAVITEIDCDVLDGLVPGQEQVSSRVWHRF